MKVLFTFLTIILSLNIYSSDTTETFELGFSDYEYYYTVSRLKNDKKLYSSQITIGIGITETFSSILNFKYQ